MDELVALFFESINQLKRRVLTQDPQNFTVCSFTDVQHEGTKRPSPSRIRLDRDHPKARRSARELLGFESQQLLVRRG